VGRAGRQAAQPSNLCSVHTLENEGAPQWWNRAREGPWGISWGDTVTGRAKPRPADWRVEKARPPAARLGSDRRCGLACSDRRRLVRPALLPRPASIARRHGLERAASHFPPCTPSEGGGQFGPVAPGLSRGCGVHPTRQVACTYRA